MPAHALHAVPPAYDFANPASFVLDPATAKPKEVAAIVEAITAHLKTHPEIAQGELPVTGWHNIGPQEALALLFRNRPGANRPVDPGTVIFYAAQMLRGDWKPTGQPVLVDADGHLVDAQHRLLGVLVSGTSIRTYVITGIEPFPKLFAYIDNSRPRTAATALQTAGLNGVSPTIAKVIRLAEEIKAGVFNPSTGATKLPRLSPAQILTLSDNYPSVRDAARSAASDWDDNVLYIGDGKRKRLAEIAYLGMAITDAYGDDVADDFMEEMRDDSHPADSPITALRKLIDKNNSVKRPLRPYQLLAALIKAFNAWHRQETLPKRWMLAVNEDFPALDGSEAEVEAAE